MFKVAGVLKTWGVDEFIACDWTIFLSVEVLANETPCRSEKKAKKKKEKVFWVWPSRAIQVGFPHPVTQK